MANAISFEKIEGLVNQARSADLNLASSLDSGAAKKNIVNLGGFPAVQLVNGDGKSGCFVFEFLGLPVTLCWEFLEFEVTDSRIEIKVKFFTKFKEEIWLTRVLVITCDDPLNSSRNCKVEIDSEDYHIAMFSPSCDWKKLATCSAPCALECGTGYACWAICAGACVLKHCSLW